MTVVPGPDAAPSMSGAATRRVVVTERRERPLRVGIILAVLGVLCFLGGILTSVVVDNAEVLVAIDRAEVGSPISFDAENRSYSLVYIRGELDTEDYRDRAVANLECVITDASGGVQTVEGRSQAVYSTSTLGSSIGTFDAVAGPTTVLCEFIRDPGGFLQNYALAPNRAAAKIVAWVVMGLGVFVGTIGGLLIGVGMRGRVVVTRVPVTPIVAENQDADQDAGPGGAIASP
jgi:hypothetical protein